MHQIVDLFEISHCLIVGTEQFAVVDSFFGQNAAADRGGLEAAHDVTVAVGTPDQAQANPSCRGGRPNRILVH